MPQRKSPLKSGTIKVDKNARGSSLENMGSGKKLKKVSAQPLKGLIKKKRGK